MGRILNAVLKIGKALTRPGEDVETIYIGDFPLPLQEALNRVEMIADRAGQPIEGNSRGKSGAKNRFKDVRVVIKAKQKEAGKNKANTPDLNSGKEIVD